MDTKNIRERNAVLRKKLAAKPNDRSLAAFIFGLEHALVAVKEGKPFVGVFNEFKQDLKHYGDLLQVEKIAPPQKKKIIKKKMAILENQLTDEDVAYLAGSYQVCHEVGDREGCRDIIEAFGWFIQLQIISLANDIVSFNDKEDYFAECWARIPEALETFKPEKGMKLPTYAYFYLLKALGMVLKGSKLKVWDVFKNGKYIKTISASEYNKTAAQLKQQGYVLKSRNLEISYDEAATSRGLKELFGIITSDDD